MGVYLNDTVQMKLWKYVSNYWLILNRHISICYSNIIVSIFYDEICDFFTCK